MSKRTIVIEKDPISDQQWEDVKHNIKRSIKLNLRGLIQATIILWKWVV